jgi:hypothetical protein
MTRTMLGRFLVPIMLAFALTGALASVAIAVDAQWDATCYSGDVCNYKNENRGTPLAATTTNDSNYNEGGDNYPATGTTINDTVTSIWNRRSSNDVIWYPFSDWGNSIYGHVCLSPGTYSNNVGWMFNDTFSSHLITVGSAC